MKCFKDNDSTYYAISERNVFIVDGKDSGVFKEDDELAIGAKQMCHLPITIDEFQSAWNNSDLEPLDNLSFILHKRLYELESNPELAQELEIDHKICKNTHSEFHIKQQLDCITFKTAYRVFCTKCNKSVELILEDEVC